MIVTSLRTAAWYELRGTLRDQNLAQGITTGPHKEAVHFRRTNVGTVLVGARQVAEVGLHVSLPSQQGVKVVSVGQGPS